MSATQTKIQRAILSVTDKTGLVEFAQRLFTHGSPESCPESILFFLKGVMISGQYEDKAIKPFQHVCCMKSVFLGNLLAVEKITSDDENLASFFVRPLYYGAKGIESGMNQALLNLLRVSPGEFHSQMKVSRMKDFNSHRSLPLLIFNVLCIIGIS